MSSIRTFLSLALLGLFTGAHAQSFDYLVANMSILQDKGVQKEIGVTEPQRAKMNKHAEWFNGQMKQMDAELVVKRKKNPKAKVDSAKVAGAQKQLKQKVFAELGAKQISRLREITLQEAGLSALLDKTVADRVGLSATQLKSLRTAWEKNTKTVNGYARQGSAEEEKAVAPVLAKYKGKPPKTESEAAARKKEVEAALKKIEPQLKKLGAKIDAVNATFDTTVGKVCTSEQLNLLRALQGPRYKPSA